MIWHPHYNLEGTHAFLSPSSPYWLRYTKEKLIESKTNADAAKRGTEIHAFAEQSIRLGVTLARANKTLNLYVNDAIKYGMDPEQVLYYSDECYGTADAIKFDEKKKQLRIHDLKTGKLPAHMEQLEVYAALFCLEYNYNPEELDMQLRIYQNDEVLCHSPEGAEIRSIMNTIRDSVNTLSEYKLKQEAI